ncbi:phosphoglycerate mutase [Massilia sp. Root351]|nr:histidine phosphatase family protein [Massilia sp. Root351]KQV83518.1 phosphoglycerate mutase [Massilia sp. Root351]
MRLILVRHPQPLVAPGVCYGSSDLAAAPHDVARVHAALLASASIPPGTPLYSSPLQRCTALTSLLGAHTLDARLAEMDFGAWERRSWDDIPRTEVDAWAADLACYRPGGGESVLQVAERVAAFRAELLARHSGAACDGRARGAHEVAIICHAGTIRLMVALEAGLQGGLPLAEIALRAAALPHKIAYGETVILEAAA